MTDDTKKNASPESSSPSADATKPESTPATATQPASAPPTPSAAPEPSAVQPSTTQSSAPKPAAVKAKLGWGARLVLLLCFLLALGAGAAAGYLVYLNQQETISGLEQEQQLEQRLNALSQSTDQIGSDVRSVRQSVQGNARTLQSLKKEDNLLDSRMASLEEAITQVTGAHRIDWMLREVEHFIAVAEQRLALLNDAEGALALLQEADGVVRAMREPMARPLREAMIDDIEALKKAAQSSIDTDGLFARINGLMKQVNVLGIPTFELYQSDPKETVAGEPRDGEEFEYFWQRFKEFLGSLVKYQKHEKSKPLLLTSQRDYLVQSVELLLQQAQLALLRGDNVAYQLSLQEAADRVNRYVIQDTDDSRFFLSEIEDLRQITLSPPVPSIEATNRAVRVFRDFWDKEKLVREQQVQALESGTMSEAEPTPKAASNQPKQAAEEQAQ